MADVPEKRSRPLSRFGTGPSLLGVGALLFVLTRIIVWLPLSFIGSWINGFIWPVILICVLAGGFLTWRGMQGSD